MLEPFIGEIQIFPYNFVPKDWAPCEGQLLNIQDYPALYALLGTIYGGNGTTTFAVPDYRGKTPIGWGTAPWEAFAFGAKGGVESQQLTEVPLHSHSFNAINKPGEENDPTNRYLGAGVAVSASDTEGIYSHNSANTTMNPGMIGAAGKQQPDAFSNIQPFQALNFCIALEGIFPPRP